MRLRFLGLSWPLLFWACSAPMPPTSIAIPSDPDNPIVGYAKMKLGMYTQNGDGGMCLVDVRAGSREDVRQVKAPVVLNLPVYQKAPGPDIVITCQMGEIKHSLIVASKRMHREDEGLPPYYQGAGRSGYFAAFADAPDLGEFMALGLSAQYANAPYYFYPEVVNVRF